VKPRVLFQAGDVAAVDLITVAPNGVANELTITVVGEQKQYRPPHTRILAWAGLRFSQPAPVGTAFERERSDLPFRPVELKE
jgi:hypothetical protein